MPNGHLDAKTRSRLDQFFSPVTSAFESFANAHDLKLGKYYHDSPSWHFSFRHPDGGVGKISISRQDQDKIGIICSWWLDNYDELKRYMKTSQKADLPLEAGLILNELENGLSMILSWKFGHWDEVSGGYKMWKKQTKEEFLSLQQQYPVPR